ncbi:MAG: PilZ domain-containing protein [Nitrospirota bacterium]
MTIAPPNGHRRPNRLPFLRPITYALGAPGSVESAQQKNPAAAINISEGGLCLLVKEPINETDIIRVDLPLADVSTTSATLAEVKWLKPAPWSTMQSPEYFVGVQFLL